MNLPERIGDRYVVERPIGQGGMGVVYLGQDIQSGQPVAIKVLHHDLVSGDSSWVERFLFEGQALRELNHPNIVKMLDAIDAGDQHYLVMEYVNGKTLAERLLAEPKMLVSDIVDIGLQIADALTRSHYLKIIHRDIKPTNILLSEDGESFLMDFGVARMRSSDLTATGAIIGTVDYLSPEAIQGQEPDERSDIWSFGVLLFEMLAGQRPFAGPAVSATLLSILSEPPPDLEALRPEAPSPLVDLIYRMLQKDPTGRIPSVRLVGAELEAIEQKLDGRAGTTSTAAGSAFPLLNQDTAQPKRLQMPADLTPFIGRATEMADLTRLFSQAGARLVTIVGPGGMGKTRLAIEAARCLADRFEDGLVFVPLAPLTSAEALMPAIWDAVDYPPVHADTRTPEEQTIDFFREKEMLIVFDNFEHVLKGAELVGQILREAPGVQVIATSAERLNLQGETLFRLEGMDYPAETTTDNALEYGAVQLFVQSAGRWRPGFEVTEENLPHIARICQLLQGLPLGVLLAAAWVDTLSVEEIAQEIAGSLDFLETEMRDVPPRQRSIRAAFEHAWRRLSPAEQETFKRLTVFRGGFNREAAQAVAGASVRQLMALVNKSLLWRDPSSGRYYSHRLLRQYAEEALTRQGQLASTQRQHAEYYADLAELAHQKLREPDETPWYHLIHEENDNFSAALNWSLVEGRDPVIGGRLFAALGFTWFITDNVVDGSIWMERSLRYVDAFPPYVRGGVYNRAGLVGCVQGNYAQAAGYHARAVQLFDQVGDLADKAYALLAQANMSYAAGLREEAFPLAAQSLETAYRAEDPWVLSIALSVSANFARRRGDEIRYRQLFQEMFELSDAFHNRMITHVSWRRKAQLARWDGKFDEALGHYKRALAISKELGWRSDELDTLQEMAYTLYRQGDLDQAKALFTDSLVQSREIIHRNLISWNLIGLGMVTLYRGEEKQAAEHFYERLRLSRDVDLTWQLVLSLAGLAKIKCLEGHEESAAVLLGAADALTNDGDLLPFFWFTEEWQQIVAELRPVVGDEAWGRGRAMTLAEAVDYALGK